MIEIKGIDGVIATVRRLQHTLAPAIAARMAAQGAAVEDRLKRDADRTFQEVPSYLVESQMGLPGRKRYPPDTLATFATTSPSIASTPWHTRIQTYPEGPHLLRDLLQHRTTPGPTTVRTEVGYPVGVGEPGSDTQYISWVLFGTKKMQPRPFLQEAFLQEGEEMQTAIGLGLADAVAALGGTR